MVGREGGAHPGEAFAEASGLLDGHAAPSGEEAPAHLVDPSRLEADGHRTVIVLLDALVRMEEERRRIPGRPRIESKDHPDGKFLERAERAFRIALQIERRVPLEALLRHPEAATAHLPRRRPDSGTMIESAR